MVRSCVHTYSENIPFDSFDSFDSVEAESKQSRSTFLFFHGTRKEFEGKNHNESKESKESKHFFSKAHESAKKEGQMYGYDEYDADDYTSYEDQLQCDPEFFYEEAAEHAFDDEWLLRNGIAYEAVSSIWDEVAAAFDAPPMSIQEAVEEALAEDEDESPNIDMDGNLL